MNGGRKQLTAGRPQAADSDRTTDVRMVGAVSRSKIAFAVLFVAGAAAVAGSRYFADFGSVEAATGGRRPAACTTPVWRECAMGEAAAQLAVQVPAR
jgi:hypothetical protein